MKPPATTKKFLTFIKYLYFDCNQNIHKRDYETTLSLFLGANHQTLATYKKIIENTRILNENPKQPAYLHIEKEAIKKWIVKTRDYFWDWDGWKSFTSLLKEVEE